MSKIHQLDEQTANMIAAGEVVERPSGVVKELIENAIDAGADEIEVALEEGGLKSLTVTDNGCGMDATDAEMAFLRHATSKLNNASQLWDIETLGFRGEALPSIASVSKLTMHTSDGNDHTEMIISYGKRECARPYPCNRGTSIKVEGLFYKTPARLKHLKSGAYENSLIQDVIMKFALSHPEIAFSLVSDERESFRTNGSGNLLEVIYQCWGMEPAQRAIPVSFSDYDYEVNGYLIKPEITRASRSCMHIFLNGRMVRTYRLYQAVMDGYEDFIVKGRKPLCVLNVKMDPHLIDVNVHPSKWEVRLSKENQLEYLIRDQVRAALGGNVLAPTIQPARTAGIQEQPQLDLKVLTEPYVGKKEVPLKQQEPAAKKEEVSVSETKPLYVHEEPQSFYRAEPFPQMKVIGQLNRKFILCECEKGLAVIDQHAAQERVHFEEFSKELNRQPDMQELLVPLTVHADASLVNRIDEFNDAICDLHIVFEPFGRDTLTVRTIPVWMKQIEIQPFLEDLVDNFRNQRESVFQRMERKKIATMACHHSIRFNRNLTMEEMEEAVRQLGKCENPYHCPHGRPTFVVIEEKELLKDFLR